MKKTVLLQGLLIALSLPIPALAQEQTAATQQVTAPAPGDYSQVGAQAPVVATSEAPALPPGTLPPLPPNSNQREVDGVLDAMLGVTPDQIREIRRMIDERQRAQAELPNPPRSITRSVSVSLSAGSETPVLRPFIGNTTSFVVVDSTGAPWPVENFRVGNGPVFPVNRLDGPMGSTFTIDATLAYAESNLVLKLAGVTTPVVVSLKAGDDEHDARVELRVQGRGPNATVTVGSLIAGPDARLLSILDGVSPEEGQPLQVNGLANVRAWRLPSGRIIVRSPVRILSPVSTSFMSSADGTHVYEFASTTQLLGMVDGQYINISLSGF